MVEVAKRSFGRDAQVLIGLSRETAFKLCVHDRERSAQIMRDVVTDALELIKKPDDLVKHEIDRACHIVEIIHLAVRRQSFLKIALHDTHNCLVDCLEAAGAAQTEYCPGGERQKDRGHDANGKCFDNNLSKCINFVKTSAKQNDAAVLSLRPATKTAGSVPCREASALGQCGPCHRSANLPVSLDITVSKLASFCRTAPHSRAYANHL